MISKSPRGMDIDAMLNKMVGPGLIERMGQYKRETGMMAPKVPRYDTMHKGKIETETDMLRMMRQKQGEAARRGL